MKSNPESQVPQLEEKKQESVKLTTQAETAKPDFEIPKGFEIVSENQVALFFSFGGSKRANYSITYTMGKEGEILVHITGSAGIPSIGLVKETDKTLKYKDQKELQQNLSIDMRNTIKTPILGEGGIIDALPETKKKIEKKIDTTSNRILYSTQNKETSDIIRNGKDLSIQILPQDKASVLKITIDKGLDNEYREFLVLDKYIGIIKKNKFEIDDADMRSFCNSIRNNVPNDMKKNITESEHKNFYHKLMKAFLMLNE